ncbi:MAG TPA: hypothetical protein VHI10_09645 [Mycobacterium sp.]|nr:hypothetical protein [Mycobacterium sp.]
MMDRPEITPISWWEAEPARLARDQREVATRFPELTWHETGAGVWTGTLPLWPLARPEPDGLSVLLGGRGLRIEVVYRQAYPMVPPRIFPLDPQPEPLEWTQHQWHVNSDPALDTRGAGDQVGDPVGGGEAAVGVLDGEARPRLRLGRLVRALSPHAPAARAAGPSSPPAPPASANVLMLSVPGWPYARDLGIAVAFDGDLAHALDVDLALVHALALDLAFADDLALAPSHVVARDLIREVVTAIERVETATTNMTDADLSHLDLSGIQLDGVRWHRSRSESAERDGQASASPAATTLPTASVVRCRVTDAHSALRPGRLVSEGGVRPRPA